MDILPISFSAKSVKKILAGEMNVTYRKARDASKPQYKYYAPLLWVREPWTQPYNWNRFNPDYHAALHKARPNDVWGQGWLGAMRVERYHSTLMTTAASRLIKPSGPQAALINLHLKQSKTKITGRTFSRRLILYRRNK